MCLSASFVLYDVRLSFNCVLFCSSVSETKEIQMRSESIEEEASCPLSDGRKVAGAKGEVMGAVRVTNV